MYFIYASQFNEKLLRLSGLCDVVWVPDELFKSEGALKYCPVLEVFSVRVHGIWMKVKQNMWQQYGSLGEQQMKRCIPTQHSSADVKKASFWCCHPIWTVEKKKTNIFVECVGPTAVMVGIVKKKKQKKKPLSLVVWEGWLVCWLTWWIPPTPPPQQSDTQT